MPNQLTPLMLLRSQTYKIFNQFMLLAPNQPILSIPNQLIPLALLKSPAYKVSN